MQTWNYVKGYVKIKLKERPSLQKKQLFLTETMNIKTGSKMYQVTH